MLTPELELQVFDGFKDWYKDQYGIELADEVETDVIPQLISLSWVAPQFEQREIVSRAVAAKSGNPNEVQREVINKIASILVDMVIEEKSLLPGSKSLKNYG